MDNSTVNKTLLKEAMTIGCRTVAQLSNYIKARQLAEKHSEAFRKYLHSMQVLSEQ